MGKLDTTMPWECYRVRETAAGENDDVPWGGCRFLAADCPDSERSIHDRQALARRPKFLIHSFLFVSSRIHQQRHRFTICRHIPSNLRPKGSSLMMYFHGGVQVVPLATSSQLQIPNDINNVLSQIERCLGAERFSASPLQSSHESRVKFEQQTLTNQRLFQHIQVSCASGPTCADEHDDSSSVDRRTPTMWIAPVVATPSPLHSITLVPLDISKEEDNVSKTYIQHPQPLFWACIKRQMVGAPIIFVEGTTTTEISVPIPASDSIMTLRVQSITTMGQQSKSSSTTSFAMIMPSTAITITKTTQTKKDPNDRPWTLDAATNSRMLAPAARLLQDTVRCLRNSSANAPSVPKTFILSGPPGVGKTYAVQTVYHACRKEGPVLLLSIGSMLGSHKNGSSDASRVLESYFKKAVRACRQDSTTVVLFFVDECDALLSNEAIAAMFATLLDSCHIHPDWQRLLVVAATNRVDSIPAFLRRPGRLDREILVGPPTGDERKRILESILASSNNSENTVPWKSHQDLTELAEACVGYVPADLNALVRRAFLMSIQEGSSHIELDHLKRAMAEVGASALRDAALSVPPQMTWDDVAGDPGGAKTALRQAIEWPRTKREAFRALDLIPPKGILLYGPPGCAKTTLARAGAGALGSAFLSLSPADVYASSYVGEAEAVVRRAFALARSAVPCILFFDEIDSILGSDEGGFSGHGMQRSGRGSSAEARVLSTFLNEMDGVDGTWEDGVLVLGATNRPWTLDAALLRPGRFDKVIYVPAPDREGRRSILNMYCQHWDAQHKINVDSLASDDLTGSMTGAEIVGACREAAMMAFREIQGNAVATTTVGTSTTSTGLVKQEHLERALRSVKPLLSSSQVLDDFEQYENRRKRAA